MSVSPAGGQVKAPPSGHLAAALGLVLTALIWGAMIPFTSRLLQVFDPFLLLVLRFGITVPFLFVFAWVVERRFPVSRHLPWRRIVILGTVGWAMFSTLYTIGIRFCDPVTAAIIFSGGPLVATLMARIMYRTPVEKGFGVSLGLAVLGGVLGVIGSPKFSGAGLGLRGGEFLLLCGMLCWNWYTLKAQEWLGDKGIGQLRLSLLTSIPGAGVFLTIFCVLYLAGLSDLPSRSLALPEIGMLLWVSTLGTGVAVALWNFGASRLGLPVASIYGNLAPVFTIIIAALVFNEDLTFIQMLGGGAVLAGVLRIQLLRLRAGRRN